MRRVKINGKWMIAKGIQNNGTRCKAGDKTFDVRLITDVHHCGDWARVELKGEKVKTAP